MHSGISRELEAGSTDFLLSLSGGPCPQAGVEAILLSLGHQPPPSLFLGVPTSFSGGRMNSDQSVILWGPLPVS